MNFEIRDLSSLEGLRHLFNREVTGEPIADSALHALGSDKLVENVTKGLYEYYSDDATREVSWGNKAERAAGVAGGVVGGGIGFGAWAASSVLTGGISAIASIPSGAFVVPTAFGVGAGGVAGVLAIESVIDAFQDTPFELMQVKAGKLVGLEIKAMINDTALQNGITPVELLEKIEKNPEQYKSLDNMITSKVHALTEQYGFTFYIDKGLAAADHYKEHSAAMDARIAELRQEIELQEADIERLADVSHEPGQDVATKPAAGNGGLVPTVS